MNEMELTAFRGDLAGVVDRLDETGPVRLTKYNDTVAEIRSATPEGDRQHLRTILAVFEYLNGLADRDANMMPLLVGLGVDTLALLAELADRHKKHASDGVTFSPYPEHSLPDEGPLTIDETLAHLYFGDDYPKDAAEPYEWFLACADIQKEATRLGMPATLPSPNAYDQDEPTFVELAISSGHTPASLREFAGRAMRDGVAPERLADMLGSEPVPADVLAMDSYNDWVFEQFTETGLPHAEVVALFRKSLTTTEAQNLAAAGIRTADEIEHLINNGIDSRLALRASRDGLTPEEWKVAVPKVQRLKYKGVGTGAGFGNERCGILPFRLLAQAAEEKVSLVRWDDNALKVRADQTNRHFHADTDKRQAMYPWVHIYPDRVLDVARAGTSPTYITAFGKLMSHCFGEATSSEEFVTTAIEAHRLGLTAAMADAMSRSDGKMPKFTPTQLLNLLREGLVDIGTAHYLAGLHADPDDWFIYMRERHERQIFTSTFVAMMENTEVWQAVVDMAQILKESANHRMRGDVHMKSIVEKFLAGQALNDHQLLVLLAQAAHAFGDLSYMPKSWREEHGGKADAIRQLAKNFDQARRGPQSEAA